MWVCIAFLRLNTADPLLCLTVSATLREKPLIPPSQKHPLARYFATVGDFSTLTVPPTPTSANGQAPDPEADDLLEGLEEINLLEGLHAGGSQLAINAPC